MYLKKINCNGRNISIKNYLFPRSGNKSEKYVPSDSATDEDVYVDLLCHVRKVKRIVIYEYYTCECVCLVAVVGRLRREICQVVLLQALINSNPVDIGGAG
jgi:hypothetical protein